jgi:hypothetical protein
VWSGRSRSRRNCSSFRPTHCFASRFA